MRKGRWDVGRSKQSLENRDFLEDILRDALPGCYRLVSNGERVIFKRGVYGFVDTVGRKKMIECWGNNTLRGEDPNNCPIRRLKYGFEVLIVWKSWLRKRRALIANLQEFHAKPNPEAIDATQ